MLRAGELLSAAGITPLADRHNCAAALRNGASETHQFVVSLHAYSESQAIERTRVAVQAGGEYQGFCAMRSAPRRAGAPWRRKN